MQEERIKNLEIKFAHQDDFIDQLNKIITNHQLTIEKLEREILELKRSHSEGTTSSPRTLADDVPPHY
jgi:SlyX protein